MANIKRANASSITKSGVAIADVPDAPTIGAVADTLAGGTVTVAYTAAARGGTATTFTATSSPGGVTATGSSPITVTGLTDGTSYTFTVTASNSTGSATSSASSSVTPTAFLTGAYDSIATVTVGTATNSISFTSIPSTYTHLQLRANWGFTDITNNTWLNATFNGDTGNNYAYHSIRANGSTVSTATVATSANKAVFGADDNGDATIWGASVVDLFDYANTNKFKTTRALAGQDRNGAGAVNFWSSLWRSTSAISTITIVTDFSTFRAGSKFGLFGIKGA